MIELVICKFFVMLFFIIFFRMLLLEHRRRVVVHIKPFFLCHPIAAVPFLLLVIVAVLWHVFLFAGTLL